MAHAGAHRPARNIFAEYHELTHKHGVPFVPEAV